MGPTGLAGAVGAAGSTGATGVGYRTDCSNGHNALWNSASASWVCSTAVSDLTTAMQSLTALVGPMEVDAYLDSLVLLPAFPVGTVLPVVNNNGGTACHFATGMRFLQVYGSDNTNGYPGGRIVALDDMGGFVDIVGVPITTAQVLSRCATGRPYKTKR